MHGRALVRPKPLPDAQTRLPSAQNAVFAIDIDRSTCMVALLRMRQVDS